MGGWQTLSDQKQQATPPPPAPPPVTPTQQATTNPPPQTPSGGGWGTVGGPGPTTAPTPTPTPTPPAPPAPKPSIFQRAKDYLKQDLGNTWEEERKWDPNLNIALGMGKEAMTALGGITDIIDDHVANNLPLNPQHEAAVQKSLKGGANWLKEQGQMRGWTEGGIGGASEHLGGMLTDYLGFEGLLSLAGAAEGGLAGLGGEEGATAAKGVLGQSEVAKDAKKVWDLASRLDGLPRAAKEAIGIGLRTLNAAGAGYTQQYVMSGGDAQQAKEAGIITMLLHGAMAAPRPALARYVSALEAEAASRKIPIPEPTYEPATPKPVYQKPEFQKPAPFQPPPFTPPEPRPAPEPQAPASLRAQAIEGKAAQHVTRQALEDQNKFRTVDEFGTPTNLGQLGLPSQSATTPYEFRIPGWSQTVTDGDLLHEPAARYKQVGTRTVEGKGAAQMQPWEMQQEPFNPLRYAETEGAIVNPIYGETQGGARTQGTPLMPEPPAAREPAEPPTERGSHREPIMQRTEFKPGLRADVQPEDIRHETTTGGPSILTTDPEIAASHLENIERVVNSPGFIERPPDQQAAILQSRSDVMRQMREFQNLQQQHAYSPYLHQPTFGEIDVDKALARTGDLNDAAREMMAGPQEMYQRWTQMTKGRPRLDGSPMGDFQTIRDEITNLGGKTDKASRIKLAKAEREMSAMFSGSDPYLGRAGTLTDKAIATSHFNDGYLMDRAGNIWTDAYKGAERTGEFDPAKLQKGWRDLVNDVGSARLRNLFGDDRYEGMNTTINNLAEEPANLKAEAKEREAADQADLDKAKAEHEATVVEPAKAQHKAAGEAARKEYETVTEPAAKEQFSKVEADWKTKDEARKRANTDLKKQWQEQEAVRLNPKQQWYYDVARNGWHHIATKAGMGAAANLIPRGILGMMSHGMGYALILKNIATNPVIAKLALQGLKLGENPATYGPLIGDLVSAYHNMGMAAPAPEPQQPQQQEQPTQ